MSAATTTLQSCKKPAAPPSLSVGGLLQRKCACGSPAASLTGQCEECKSKVRLQAKLTIGASDDPLEQEADRVADQVLAAGAIPRLGYLSPRVPRYAIQASRQDMEWQFGHDSSQVWVHTGAKATESTRHTHKGPCLHCRSKHRLRHESIRTGLRLLSHELTHGVQQRARGHTPTGRAGTAAAGCARCTWCVVSRAARDGARQQLHGRRRRGGQRRPLPSLKFYRANSLYAPETTAGRKLLAHELTPVLQQRESFRESHVLQRKSDKPSGQTSSVPASSLPVPGWEQLPGYTQAALESREYDKQWFDNHDEVLRLTVLNLFVKLHGLGLWKYVLGESGTGPGTLNFICGDIEGLKNTLRDRDDFTSPEESSEEWSSREMKARGQLHFKHFKNWPTTKIEAHIDQYGLLLRSKLWWLFPPVPLTQMIIHKATYQSYKDVLGIRDILISEGWDPVPLKGMAHSPLQE